MALAVACVLVVLLIMSLIVDPIVQARREDISIQEPIVAFVSWDWSGGIDFELDLQPMTYAVMNQSIPQVGSLSAWIKADPNVPEPRRELKTPQPLQQLGSIGGAYYKEKIPFSEGRSFVLGSFLTHSPQNISTQFSVYVASTSDRSALKNGHLSTFLDGVLLKESEFDLFHRDTATSEYYLEYKDLGNNKISLLWTGSQTIQVWGRTTYIVTAQSADYVVYLSILASCTVERRLSSYLGLGQPKHKDCELIGYTDLPPTT